VDGGLMSKKSHKKTMNTEKPIRTLVDIVIAVHQRFDILSRCLEAIPSAMGDIPYRIYIVDNASPLEEANSFYSLIKPPIMVTRNKENMGFARACNQGASRGNSPLIFFLNSDVILDDKSIPVLVAEMDDPKIGVCGMKLVFPDDVSMYKLNGGIRPAGKIQHVGLMTNIRGEFVHAFIGWDANHPKPNACRDMYAVTGAALMTRRNLFTKIRGFNEIYGAGTFEDVEFCLMVREMGYNVIVNTSACGVHYTGATSEKYQIQFPLEYNRMTFLQRWANKLTWDEYKKW
jgi:GT2 family glycosyltransferase